MCVLEVGALHRVRFTCGVPSFASGPTWADGSGPTLLTERAPSGPGVFEAPPEGMNSKSLAELACRPRAKKRRLVSMGKQAGSRRAQHSHLAQALSVTLGEHGELQVQSQQLHGGHGRTHLRNRRDRTREVRSESAQGIMRATRTLPSWRAAGGMFGG